MSFKDFKKQLNKINENLKELDAKKPSYNDERFWNITKDTTGNGKADIRFLPQKDPSKLPIVLTYRHSFEYKGKWFIENCPVTAKEKCPICEFSAEHWKTNEELARKFWRSKTYIANILVVDDPAKPENNGKVFMYKFGQKIYDMIKKVTQNEDDGDNLSIFDFDEGHNFKLRMIQYGGFNNYDKESSFSIKATAIANGDIEEQEKIYNQIYDLDEFFNAEQFKTYEELEKKLNNLLGSEVQRGTIEDDLKTAMNNANQLSSSDKRENLINSDDDATDFADLASITLDDNDDIPF